jgi:serine/threonine-protein kinase PknK
MSDRSSPLLTHSRYQPLALVNQGAQGVVFRVRDREQPERSLVAKLWKSQRFSTDALRSEFTWLSRLRLPGVVGVVDFGYDSCTGDPFLVEEWVPGVDAAAWVQQVPLAERSKRLWRLATEVASTLAVMHQAGVMHGDLKPEHIVVPDSGPITLIDLGTALASGVQGEAQPHGWTQGYVAPELLAGAPLSNRAELFSLGATLWVCATGTSLPSDREQGSWKSLIRWLDPGLRDVMEALLAVHPQDRPTSADDVLQKIGHKNPNVTRLELRSTAIPLVGRQDVVEHLLGDLQTPVRYVTGEAGVGKTHVLTEVALQARLQGRTVRLVDVRLGTGLELSHWTHLLRHPEKQWPWLQAAHQPWVIFDNFASAPEELRDALDVFRCYHPHQAVFQVVVAAGEAPQAPTHCQVRLGPLSPSYLEKIAGYVGETSQEMLPSLIEQAKGNPGWLLTLLGKHHLSEDLVRSKAETWTVGTRQLLSMVAACGGQMCWTWLEQLGIPGWEQDMQFLISSGLLVRAWRDQRRWICLQTAHLNAWLKKQWLVDNILNSLINIVCADPQTPAVVWWELADCPIAEPRHQELWERTAEKASKEGMRALEREALWRLVSSPATRNSQRLLRLEKLCRDSGKSQAHPEVLGWLEQAAEQQPELWPLVARKKAERCAKEGKFDQADTWVDRSEQLANKQEDLVGQAFACATRGMVGLYRSDWSRARRSLEQAQELLLRSQSAGQAAVDPEEQARLEHNQGVVFVYQNQMKQAEQAFRRSLAVKEALGDRAGMRTCLRNVGYVLVRQSRLTEAERVLDQAFHLAQTLGDISGQAWCLATKTEVELKRCNWEQAARWLQELEPWWEQCPATLQADIWLLRSELASAQGDGLQALQFLEHVNASFRANDALVDGRALVLEAKARLRCVPVRQRQVGMLLVKALRRVRTSSLPEIEQQVLELWKKLREFKRNLRKELGTEASMSVFQADPKTETSSLAKQNSQVPSFAQSWLEALAMGEAREKLERDLIHHMVAESKPERVFWVQFDVHGTVVQVWGWDHDTWPIAAAGQRFPKEISEKTWVSNGMLYEPMVEHALGTGSLLAMAVKDLHNVGWVLVLEHRFRSRAFDHLHPDTVRPWLYHLAMLVRYVIHQEQPVSTGIIGSSKAPFSVTVPVQADVSDLHVDRPSLVPEKRPVYPETTWVPVRKNTVHVDGIIGKSDALQRALGQVEQAAHSAFPVLIEGETGVGKELFARAIHDLSDRCRGPWVALNCAAIAEHLFESELFGHARGAFTHAEKTRPGLIAQAEGGTLFLDEVAELSPARQATLLRVLQTQHYRAVGSDQERHANVRIVAATNLPLEQAVADGTFRKDLMFRLNVLRIAVPALRERRTDIPLLVAHFQQRLGLELSLQTQVMTALQAYDWPGNIRELEHQVQRWGTLGVDTVELRHLPRGFRTSVSAYSYNPDGSEMSAKEEPPPNPLHKGSEDLASGASEVVRTQQALQQTQGNISQAAKILGLTRHGLKKRMLRLGIRSFHVLSG